MTAGNGKGRVDKELSYQSYMSKEKENKDTVIDLKKCEHFSNIETLEEGSLRKSHILTRLF